MLIILFGLSGSGKNFVAEILERKFGFEFFDADRILPSDMLECIKHKMMFTQDMRDNFTCLIKKKLADLQDSCANRNIVLTQALYKEKNRADIHAAFPDARFIQVLAEPAMIQARLEKSRGDVDPDYASKISKNFEPPLLTHLTLINNTNEADITNQLEQLFTISPKYHRRTK